MIIRHLLLPAALIALTVTELPTSAQKKDSPKEQQHHRPAHLDRQNGQVRLRHRLRSRPAARRRAADQVGRVLRSDAHGAGRRPHAAASRRQRGTARQRQGRLRHGPLRLLRRRMGLLRQVHRRQTHRHRHPQDPRQVAQDRPAHRPDLHAEHGGGRLVEGLPHAGEGQDGPRLRRLQPRPLSGSRRQGRLHQQSQRPRPAARLSEDHACSFS